ncbi:NAD(P)-binding domain-containing protein [Cesiribacter sp. SM1]|uniref:NAD(P)-binding domain-containing protein n=1 Tax=Cesiribacter sp. SM1 TaxID=2861196 RepID=UPI001CD7BD37|nr:NAD(P)-binding domain-containing protein [Cesiribacter sp. SM1]
MVLDVIVIGASQAGLAMGYFLKQKELSFAIIGRESRLGDIWRNRYDSLELFTPRWLSALPGIGLSGDPMGYAGKDEISDYLEQYAKKFYLPVLLQVDVHRLEKGEAYLQSLPVRANT